MLGACGDEPRRSNAGDPDATLASFDLREGHEPDLRIRHELFNLAGKPAPRRVQERLTVVEEGVTILIGDSDRVLREASRVTQSHEEGFDGGHNLRSVPTPLIV